MCGRMLHVWPSVCVCKCVCAQASACVCAQASACVCVCVHKVNVNHRNEKYTTLKIYGANGLMDVVSEPDP